MLTKAGKALDLKNVESAISRTENVRLAEELEARKLIRRKKIEDDPNGRFASLAKIKKAQKELRRKWALEEGTEMPSSDLEISSELEDEESLSEDDCI